MDKDVRVKAYLTEVYECPPNCASATDALFEKQKAEKKKAMKKGGDALTAPVVVDRTGCRPCDQPHFFVADSPGPSASAPCWWPTTHQGLGHRRPQAADRQAGRASSCDWHLLHQLDHRVCRVQWTHYPQEAEDMQGKVLPRATRSCPEAQTIQLEGQTPQIVGWAAHQKGGESQPKGDKAVPGGKKK